MARIRSFPPIVGDAPRTLILGTMPGVASLTARQYYAHPRNLFWTIMGRLLGFDCGLEYQARTQRLTAARIAVWDVLATCERPGSLDAAIDRSSIVANDFRQFFARHPTIERVCFNGSAAQALYRRHVARTLADGPCPIYVRLPSTSPANASISPSMKARAWRTVVACTAPG